MPPYSIAVSSTARSVGRNDALRTSSAERTVRLTSARVVARTAQAAKRSSPARLPATTTQFTDCSRGRPYASVMAAVSASSGSMAATSTRCASAASASPRAAQDVRASRTGAPSSSGADSAGNQCSAVTAGR